MIKDLTGAYLRAVDEALPGFVEKLYVVGSAALGAWVPHASDVDTVIVTLRVASPSDLAVLARVHEAMPAKPHLGSVSSRCPGAAHLMWCSEVDVSAWVNLMPAQ
ncbi:nucleotidyltransferase domain-containing protein [Micromonospora sp. NPDC047670]|uniref:nucleotidyltransferase domain-containing protein n=1 Tax=Micromonospora sp. NPDC047670 TaxID=3364252 RepID=UPI0037146BEE